MLTVNLKRPKIEYISAYMCFHSTKSHLTHVFPSRCWLRTSKNDGLWQAWGNYSL